MKEIAVQVDHLRMTYGSTVAVEDVSLTVHAGEIFGILGPNGAGKTTTVESIAGLRVPDAGGIRVHGVNPITDRQQATRSIGVQLQESRLQPKITVREALQLWSAFYDDPEPWPELADRLGLSRLLDQQFRTLSGGQQQRLSIALALMGRPRVAILDELTTGLDPQARREVWQLVRDVRDRGVTVLLVTHAMEEAQGLCDRIAIINGGRVRALDTPDGLIGRAAAATVTSFVVDTAVEQNITMVGLSALMTTTLKSMEDTITLIRQTKALQNPDGTSRVRVFVGGAVLTADYAMKIGADYYCRDAKESVDTAKLVFGE